MKDSKILLCGGIDVDEFFDDLVNGVIEEPNPNKTSGFLSDDEWHEIAETIARDAGLTEEQKDELIKMQ